MNEYVNATMAMIQKLIAVATPVAKQAYEISLLTLQIDAGAALFKALLFVLFGFFTLCFSYRAIQWDLLKNEKEEVVPQGMVAVFLGGSAGIVGIACICVNISTLLSIWLWVKLFRPELWLVHMAIEKLVK